MALKNDLSAEIKSDLTNYNGATDGQAYILLGESVPGDTPARFYFYKSAATDTVDGENVLSATGMGVGRFLKNPVQEFNNGLAAVAYSNDYNDLINKPSGSSSRTSGTVSRSLVTTTSSTGFQISSTLDYNVNYSVYAQVTSALIGTNTADVFLEIANTNSTTPGDWTTIARSGISVAGIVSTSGNTQTVSGFIPAGKFVRLRTLPTGANSGSAVFTYQVGQENSY